jgi:hypothetical protein
MTYRIVILGASYGSLLGTKLLMAGHDVTLVCRQATADLINAEGTDVRIKLRDEVEHRAFRSHDLPGTLNALAPEDVNPAEYDMVALAMSEPQYCADNIVDLLGRIAAAPSRGAGYVAARGCLYLSQGLGRVQARHRHAVQPRSAGVSRARGRGQHAACRPAHEFQGRPV